jgi:hypothetical protein
LNPLVFKDFHVGFRPHILEEHISNLLIEIMQLRKIKDLDKDPSFHIVIPRFEDLTSNLFRVHGDLSSGHIRSVHMDEGPFLDLLSLVSFDQS